MAVPSSGPISLARIRDEIDNNDYYHSFYGYTSGPTSLRNLSDGTYDTINTGSSNRPNGSSPHAVFEFLGYDHDAINMVSIGSTYTGQYSSTSWESVSINMSAFKGETVRFIFHYVSGTSFTGDIQIDNVEFPKYFTYGQTGGYFQGWSYSNNSFGTSSFTSASSGTNGGNWQTTTTDTSSYANASWSTVSAGTTAGRWNGRSGGTPSGTTGLSSGFGGSGYYVYAETSAGSGSLPDGHPSKNFWLRSGTHDIGTQTGTPYFGYKLGRYGSTIGTLETYVERI